MTAQPIAAPTRPTPWRQGPPLSTYQDSEYAREQADYDDPREDEQ